MFNTHFLTQHSEMPAQLLLLLPLPKPIPSRFKYPVFMLQSTQLTLQSHSCPKKWVQLQKATLLQKPPSLELTPTTSCWEHKTDGSPYPETRRNSSIKVIMDIVERYIPTSSSMCLLHTSCTSCVYCTHHKHCISRVSIQDFWLGEGETCRPCPHSVAPPCPTPSCSLPSL